MTAREARLHIRYSGWASQKLLDAAAALTEEQRTRSMEVSHESLQQTLAHIYFADSVWYTRAVDPSRPVPSPDDRPSMESLMANWPDLQRRWEAWADSVSDAGLERVAQFKLRNGASSELPVWQIVNHVVNHATLHRGQVVAMMRQLGAKPPATDILWYYREHQAASIAP
ncbi:MAG TPA: DinB family protein [Bryobacteraceae bacterium]|nr:DinB family protein [Bryobacteraceae bacterium]